MPINNCDIEYEIKISILEIGAKRKSSNEPICLLLIIDM